MILVSKEPVSHKEQYCLGRPSRYTPQKVNELSNGKHALIRRLMVWYMQWKITINKDRSRVPGLTSKEAVPPRHNECWNIFIRYNCRRYKCNTVWINNMLFMLVRLTTNSQEARLHPQTTENNKNSIQKDTKTTTNNF